MRHVSSQPDASLPVSSENRFSILFELLHWSGLLPGQQALQTASYGQQDDSSGGTNHRDDGSYTLQDDNITGQPGKSGSPGTLPQDSAPDLATNLRYKLSDDFTAPEIFPFPAVLQDAGKPSFYNSSPGTGPGESPTSGFTEPDHALQNQAGGTGQTGQTVHYAVQASSPGGSTQQQDERPPEGFATTNNGDAGKHGYTPQDGTIIDQPYGFQPPYGFNGTGNTALPLTGDFLANFQPILPDSFIASDTLSFPAFGQTLDTIGFHNFGSLANPETNPVFLPGLAGNGLADYPAGIADNNNIDHQAFALFLHGAAFSYGSEGTTGGIIDAGIIDFGPYSAAIGHISFSATSAGYNGEPAYTQVQTSVGFVGADFIFSTTLTSQTTSSDGDIQVSSSYSSTWFVAIDIDNFSPAGNSAEYSLVLTETILEGGSFAPGNIVDAAISPNSFQDREQGLTQQADISVNGYVLAPYSHVQIDSTALAYQNTYSYIEGGAYLIA